MAGRKSNRCSLLFEGAQGPTGRLPRALEEAGQLFGVCLGGPKRRTGVLEQTVGPTGETRLFRVRGKTAGCSGERQRTIVICDCFNKEVIIANVQDH